MQIVSGPIGKEKIHYVALPYKQINSDIKYLLSYINNSDDNIYIKSAIAHLWFVTIHPYDDGNGRIARIISDYIISKEFGLEYKYFSISNAILKERKYYYNHLESTQNILTNPNLDLTLWIKWYLNIFNNSLLETLDILNTTIIKMKFWDKYKDISLNQRQIKVLKKLLDYTLSEFKGGLTTKKYISITKTSSATAKRDMKELVKYGCISQINATIGRNVKYRINLDNIK